MNIKSITDKPLTQPITLEEAMHSINEYVKARKGIDPNLILDTRFGNGYNLIQIKMICALSLHAIQWFKNN